MLIIPISVASSIIREITWLSRAIEKEASANRCYIYLSFAGCMTLWRMLKAGQSVGIGYIIWGCRDHDLLEDAERFGCHTEEL